MRSLSSSLLAAQKAASGTPLVRAVVNNTIRGLRHLVFTQTFSSGATDDKHGAAADATYLHRCAVNGGGVYYERNAGTGFTNMAAGATSTLAAIAVVNNARVILVYNKSNSIYMRESTNQGTSFAAETLVVATAGPLNAIAVAYKNASGDLVIFYAEGANMKRIRRTTGAFGAVTTWTQTAATINGAAVAWNGDFLLVITGTETTTLRPTLWSLILGDGFSFTTDTWTAFFIQAQAESDESVTFQAPSVAVMETPRMTFVEKYSGTPSYTRTYWSAIALTATFSPGSWEWLDAVPLNNATNFGYAVTKGLTPVKAIYSRPAQVLQAPTAAETLDMTADLLEATIEERDGITQRAELVFDNTNGQYAGPPSPIALHRMVDLGLGYGAEYSRPPALTITGWEYRRDGGKSRFVLHSRGVDYWLGLSRTRTSIVETRKMTQIARAAGARAGLDFLSSGASSRATNFNIDWVVHPHQTQLQVLRALDEIMPDIFLTFSVSTLMITEPTAADAVDYTYGTDHAIYHSRFADETSVGLAEVIAAGVLGQAFDFAVINNDKPEQERRRSPHETSASDANAHASARLRKAVLAKDLGLLVTPPNCGLEIGDVVAFTDAAVGPSQVKARVKSIVTIYKRAARAVFEQRVALGGV